MPASLWERNLKKIKAEDLLPKTSAFIFLPVGLADYGQRKTNYVLVVNENFKPFSKKNRARRRGLFQEGMTGRKLLSHLAYNLSSLKFGSHRVRYLPSFCARLTACIS